MRKNAALTKSTLVIAVVAALGLGGTGGDAGAAPAGQLPDTIFSLALTDNSGGSHNGNSLLTLTFDQGATADAGTVVSRALYGTSPPAVDGDASDTAWADAQMSTVPISPQSGDNGISEATVQAAHDGENVYVRVSWVDPTGTENIARRATTYDLASQEFRRSGNEDRVFLMWNIDNSIANWDTAGCTITCHAPLMHTNAPGEIGDIWHWKAARSNPYGRADDKNIDDVDRQSDAGTNTYAGNGNTTDGPAYVWNGNRPSDTFPFLRVPGTVYADVEAALALGEPEGVAWQGSAASVAQAAMDYAAQCAACHGADATGGAGGPDITHVSHDHPADELLAVMDGTSDEADMSPFVTGTATAQDFVDLIQVLTTFPGEVHRRGFGSRDELVAFGDYDDATNTWTVELSRALHTGNADDYQFLAQAPTVHDTIFSLALTDNSGGTHNGDNILNFTADQSATADPDNVVALDNSGNLPPVIDGVADDAVWTSAQTSTVAITPMSGDNGITQATVQAARDAENVYFRVTWADPSSTENIARRATSYDLATQTFSRSGNEDRCFFMWNIDDSIANWDTAGCTITCHAPLMHTNDVTERGDIWHWKAARSNPYGRVDDKNIDFEDRQSDAGTNTYTSNGNTTDGPAYVWNGNRPSDTFPFLRVPGELPPDLAAALGLGEPEGIAWQGTAAGVAQAAMDYAAQCAGCHGADATGGMGGPDLIHVSHHDSADEILAIMDGTSAEADMSPFVTGTATAQDFVDLIQVLTTFPGEAHRKGSGSRDDVVSFGVYDSGTWTVEISRPLFTANSDDYQFASSLLLGDANNDLRFDAADVVTVVNHINGAPITDPQLFVNVDTNDDDSVDATDLGTLVDRLLGL
jgi:mono/diheme cytochrome c family protein